MSSVLRRGGKIIQSGLEMVGDEVLLALKSNIILEDGFTLRDFCLMLASYSRLHEVDARVMLAINAHKARNCSHAVGSHSASALMFSRSVLITSICGALDFDIHDSFVVQLPNGDLMPAEGLDFPALLGYRLILGPGEIMHDGLDNDFNDLASNIVLASNSSSISFLDFLSALLNCFYPIRRQLHPSAIVASALDTKH